MWRTIIRVAPLALAGYKWWQRKQAQKKGQTGRAGPAVGGPHDDRLP